MRVKFSASSASPAGPVILASIEAGFFRQTVSLTPDYARELYRMLGDALLDLPLEQRTIDAGARPCDTEPAA